MAADPATSPQEAREAGGSAAAAARKRPGRRPGRRPGNTDSRERILAAARHRFGSHGYAGTSIRAVAQQAEVDAALVYHFFTSKEGLFEASMRDAVQPAELRDTVLAGTVAGMGERMARAFLALWESGDRRDQLASILRSAVSHQAAAEMVRRFVVREVLLPVAQAAGHSRPEVRAGLMGSQLIGLALTRYIVEVPPLATMELEEVVAAVAPTLQRYLTGAVLAPVPSVTSAVG
ncbi:TetR family transcriptional regulator [Streptomyces sp.]|uniref:TetR/AcrR family transcriptional regulator n=1 Tax=Streptomyces sp. TaxID=1931 RepID=UPI002F415344